MQRSALGTKRDETPVEQLKAEPTGPGRFARAYGLSATEATHVFTLGNGIAISVAANATAKCLFASRDQSNQRNVPHDPRRSTKERRSA